MKLSFLGTGSAFTVGDGNYQSNMILETDEGKKLLIDCGTDIRFSLYNMNMSYLDISDIYISHLHADHVGGLEYIGLNRKFDPRCGPTRIFISEIFRDSLWMSVQKGLKYVEGEITDINSFFEIIYLKKDGSFEWEGINFKLIDCVHMHNGFFPVPSFGLLFKIGDTETFITTDTQYTFDNLKEYYESADIIFHDCETSKNKSGVHAHFDELKHLPPEYKSKMWLYHYHPGKLPDAQKEGFKGFVEIGQEFRYEN